MQLRILLYVHFHVSQEIYLNGNIGSRLNIAYVNQASLKSSTYVYFLGHAFLSFALYCNNDLELEDLKVNIENLNLLKSLS